MYKEVVARMHAYISLPDRLSDAGLLCFQDTYSGRPAFTYAISETIAPRLLSVGTLHSAGWHQYQNAMSRAVAFWDTFAPAYADTPHARHSIREARAMLVQELTRQRWLLEQAYLTEQGARVQARSGPTVVAATADLFPMIGRLGRLPDEAGAAAVQAAIQG